MKKEKQAQQKKKQETKAKREASQLQKMMEEQRLVGSVFSPTQIKNEKRGEIRLLKKQFTAKQASDMKTTELQKTINFYMEQLSKLSSKFDQKFIKEEVFPLKISKSLCKEDYVNRLVVISKLYFKAGDMNVLKNVKTKIKQKALENGKSKEKKLVEAKVNKDVKVRQSVRKTRPNALIPVPKDATKKEKQAIYQHNHRFRKENPDLFLVKTESTPVSY